MGSFSNLGLVFLSFEAICSISSNRFSSRSFFTEVLYWEIFSARGSGAIATFSVFSGLFWLGCWIFVVGLSFFILLRMWLDTKSVPAVSGKAVKVRRERRRLVSAGVERFFPPFLRQIPTDRPQSRKLAMTQVGQFCLKRKASGQAQRPIIARVMERKAGPLDSLSR